MARGPWRPRRRRCRRRRGKLERADGASGDRQWNAHALVSVVEHDLTRGARGGVEHEGRLQIRGGDVILLHDGGHRGMGADRSQTVLATDHLITRYKSEGYEFVTIPQMMSKESIRAGPTL